MGNSCDVFWEQQKNLHFSTFSNEHAPLIAPITGISIDMGVVVDIVVLEL